MPVHESVRRSRRSARGSLVSLAVVLPVALTGLGALTAGAAAAPGATDGTAAKRPTPYAMVSRGYGTKVRGGEVPAGSDTTAYQRISCTNKAGISRRTSEADVVVPGLGTVSGVSTALRTTKRRGVVAATSVQRVAAITLVDSPLGSLRIEGLRARARAFHTRDGFDAIASTEVGRIVFEPAAGPAQELELPSPGEPLEVPGLAEIRVGPHDTNRSAGGARARATTLIIDVIPSGTTATVGLARAKIDSGVLELLFRGGSSGIRARAVEGLLVKKRTPLSLMPCQGTEGRTLTKDLAGVDLTGAISVGALSSEQFTRQGRRVSRGYERGSVAGLNLGDGRLVIDAVVAQANMVKRDGKRIRFNARGTTVGSITANGEPQTFPDTGPLEIPGVASIEPSVTERKNGVFSVVGLRITLLDGTGGVIELGTAKIGGKRSGR